MILKSLLVICLPLFAARSLPAQEEKTSLEDSFLLPDPQGAGRPRLGMQGLLPGFERGQFRIKIGGYFDLEYRDQENAKKRFRAHRFVPLFEGQVSEKIRFQAEVEIEDGGELGIEFAHVDWELHPNLAFRAGIILLPLGRLNLVHDSPIQEFTDRPLLDTKVIPTTLRDAGVGFHGRFPFGDEGPSLRFEAVLHGGFRGQDKDGTYRIDRNNGLRLARPHGSTSAGFKEYEDNNDGFAFTGRIALRDPGYELGLSLHRGAWDNRGDLSLSTLALDAELSPAALPGLRDSIVADWIFRFEGAISNVERDAAARAGAVPGKLGGWYAEWGWKIPLGGQGKGIFEPGSRLTLLLRHGRVDLSGAGFERTVLGITLRPNQDKTVFKLEYQWNGERGTAPGEGNDALLFSVATYF
jgi:hypothetical protein